MPDPNAVALLHAIHQAAPETSDKGEFWVYVGEYNQQTHSFGNPLNFDVTAPPAVNSTITASQDVYERDVKPYKDAGGWHLGTIKGVLPRGKTVRVQDAARIEGENDYDFNSWVKVKPQ